MQPPVIPGRNWDFKQAAEWHAEQSRHWRETAKLYRRLYIAALCALLIPLALDLIRVTGADR